MKPLLRKILFTAHFQAGALVYALVVVAVLAALSLALISLSSAQRMLFDRDGLQIRLTQQALQGIELLSRDTFRDASHPLWLSGEIEDDTLRLERRPWGLFDLLHSTAWRHTAWRLEKVNRIALAGLAPDSIDRAALFLQENFKPLSLAGNTLLRGAAYLPQTGLQTGYVNTQGFTGSRLLEGKQYYSGVRMPPLDKKRLASAVEWPGQATRITELPAFAQVSFDTSTLIVHGKILRLTACNLKGNILLAADSFIQVSRNTTLEDVILIAPEIRIDDYFEGSLQALARRKLDIGKGVYLKYPSVLALLPKAGNLQVPQGQVGDKSRVEGLIFSHSNSTAQDPAPELYIGSNAIVTGQVYADGALALEGIVYGNVTCRHFTLNTGASLYDNFLFNATIDASRLPEVYALPLIRRLENRPRQVAKWVE